MLFALQDHEGFLHHINARRHFMSRAEQDWTGADIESVPFTDVPCRSCPDIARLNAGSMRNWSGSTRSRVRDGWTFRWAIVETLAAT
jgi:hypothetical protein